MDIKELIKEAYDNAIERGFNSEDQDYCQYCKEYDNCDSEYREPSGSCDLFVNPNKNIGELLMLIVSELGEALEAHRCGRFTDKEALDDILKLIKGDSKLGILAHYPPIKNTFEDEIADAFIRIFNFMGYMEYEYEKVVNIFQPQKINNLGEFFMIICGKLNYIYDQIVNDIDYEEINPCAYTCQIIDFLLEYCNYKNIPIEKHIKAKMAYNRTRPHKHNKEY